MLRLAFIATLVLVVLKAVSAISWPWLWTLIPLAIWGAYVLVMTVIGLVIAGLGLLVVWWANRKDW